MGGPRVIERGRQAAKGQATSTESGARVRRLKRVTLYLVALCVFSYVGYAIGIGLATMNHVPLTDDNVQQWIKIPVPATIVLGLSAVAALLRRRDARQAHPVAEDRASWTHPSIPPPPPPPPGY
jgi:hypothetical protein